MVNKPMTLAELAALDGISPDDKQLIENAVSEFTDNGEQSQGYLREFLADAFLANEATDSIRDDLGGDAACFIDGWIAGLEYCQQQALKSLAARTKGAGN